MILLSNTQNLYMVGKNLPRPCWRRFWIWALPILWEERTWNRISSFLFLNPRNNKYQIILSFSSKMFQFHKITVKRNSSSLRKKKYKYNVRNQVSNIREPTCFSFSQSIPQWFSFLFPQKLKDAYIWWIDDEWKTICQGTISTQYISYIVSNIYLNAS